MTKKWVVVAAWLAVVGVAILGMVGEAERQRLRRMGQELAATHQLAEQAQNRELEAAGYDFSKLKRFIAQHPSSPLVDEAQQRLRDLYLAATRLGDISTKCSGGDCTVIVPWANAGPVGLAAGWAAEIGRQRQAADAKIEEEVRNLAKPADIRFSVPTKMSLGKVYEARLEIVRPSAKSMIINPVIQETVEVLDRATASLSSAFLKIDRLNSEWQDVPAGKRAIWLWRIEPVAEGKTQLLVTVEHAAKVQDQERRWTVEHFPQEVEIEITWWQSLQLAIAGFSPPAQAAATIVTAVVTISGTAYGFFVWLDARRKRKRKSVTRAKKKAAA